MNITRLHADSPDETLNLHDIIADLPSLLPPASSKASTSTSSATAAVELGEGEFLKACRAVKEKSPHASEIANSRKGLTLQNIDITVNCL